MPFNEEIEVILRNSFAIVVEQFKQSCQVAGVEFFDIYKHFYSELQEDYEKRNSNVVL